METAARSKDSAELLSMPEKSRCSTLKVFPVQSFSMASPLNISVPFENRLSRALRRRLFPKHGGRAMKHSRQLFIILYMMSVLSTYAISMLLTALKLCVPLGSFLMAFLRGKF